MVPLLWSVIPFLLVKRERRWVMVKWGSFIMIRIYTLPSWSLVCFETFLNQLWMAIVYNGAGPLLLLGNFNSKSIVWDSPTMDTRLLILLDWAANLDFLLNQEFMNTCMRYQSQSLNLSWDMCCHAPYLRIMEKMEMFSDYIYTSPCVPSGGWCSSIYMRMPW